MFPTGQTTVDVIRSIVVEQLNNSIPNFDFTNRVVIYNQKYVIPPDDGLWAEIAFVNSKIYSSQQSVQTVNEVFQEVQSLYQAELIMIRLFSENTDALKYKELVAMGFNSIYAKQLQEQYSFKICNVIPYPDTSELEGGAILYRADISSMCLVAYENIITAGYLNKFITQVTASKGSLTMQQTFNPAVLP